MVTPVIPDHFQKLYIATMIKIPKLIVFVETDLWIIIITMNLCEILTILASTCVNLHIDKLYHVILITYTFTCVGHVLQQSFLD